MILKEDFIAWLDDPCTKFFRAWLVKDKNVIKEAELEKIYHSFDDKEAVSSAAMPIGICHGLDRVIDMLEECNTQKEEERAQLELDEKDRPPVDDTITDHIKFVYSYE
jgi:hypothetical protein